LIDNEEIESIEKHAEKDQVVDNGISIQTYVVNRGADYWKQIRHMDISNKIYNPKEIGILEVACAIPQRLPSDKQCRVLIDIEKKAIEQGFPAQ
jgi:hypothetical protein